MGYILDGHSNESIEEFQERFRKYYEYIESVKHLLPASAYTFATAPWHYNYSDHRCPHDAWFETMTIQDQQHRTDNEVSRWTTTIHVRLLGAYHDGYIELTYKNVHAYLLENHGDWITDEVRLSANGMVEHEIAWLGGKWIIECEDIVYEWKPFLETAVDTIDPCITT